MYKLISVLGEGGYGVVYECVYKQTTKCALKRIVNDKDGIININEIDIISRMNHPNIMSSINKLLCLEKIYLILPLAKTSFDKISNISKLSETVKEQYITSLVNTVQFIHSCGIYHGDIKPANLLILDDKLILTDFGLSIHQHKINTDCIQSIHYRPPELFIETSYQNHEASDIWALGLTIVYILSGKTFFNYYNNTDRINSHIRFFKNPITTLLKYINIKYVNAILSLLIDRSIQVFIRQFNIKSDNIGEYKSIIRRNYEITHDNQLSINKINIKNSITRFTINILSEWMYNVCFKFNLTNYVYIGGLDLVMRVVDRISDMKLVGIASILIMSKILTNFDIEIIDCIYITDNKYDNIQIRKMEISILEWVSGYIYPNDLFRHNCINQINKYLTVNDYINLLKN